MNKIYHSTSEYTDKEAAKVFNQINKAVLDAGGSVGVSRAFSYGSAVVVLELPEGIPVESVAPGVPFEEYVDVE